MSELCATVSTKQYLPLAVGISNAWIWAFATSFTLIHPPVSCGNICPPTLNKHGKNVNKVLHISSSPRNKPNKIVYTFQSTNIP